jgi:hypothetical protein
MAIMGRWKQNTNGSYIMPECFREPNGLHRMVLTFWGSGATGAFHVIIDKGVIREPIFGPTGKRLARKKVRRLMPNLDGTMVSRESKRRDERDRYAPAVVEALGSDTGTLIIDMQEGGIKNIRRHN